MKGYSECSILSTQKIHLSHVINGNGTIIFLVGHLNDRTCDFMITRTILSVKIVRIVHLPQVKMMNNAS